jgi:hypothetical protein
MAIDNADIERLKEIFVTKDKCDTDMSSMDKKLSNDDKRLAVMEQQISSILKIVWFIAAGVGSLVIGSLWRLIAK